MLSGTRAEEVEQAVLAALRQWLAATMAADADALEGLLAEGYTYTHAMTAAADSREKWIESYRSGGRRYQVYEVADLSIRAFPGTVVVTGRAHQEKNPRGEQIELNTTFTSVWVEIDGKWKVAAWQATRIPDPR